MKKTAIIVGIILLAAYGGYRFFVMQAKSKSPEQGFDFVEGDLKIHVFYNRPYKRGRDIFSKDGLVPFGKVWRTGANEPTYIESNKTLFIKGKELPPGKYSVWTIPDENSWTVIFNSEYPSWGINFNGEPNHDAKKDVLTVQVPTAVIPDKEFEQFTISIERVGDELELNFLWDKTLVSVPFTLTAQ